MAQKKTTAKKEARDKNVLLAFLFDTLSTPIRLHIVDILKEEKTRCVSSIAEDLSISVPAASYQLKTMELVGLIQKDRVGRTTCYRLNQTNPTIKRLIEIVSQGL